MSKAARLSEKWKVKLETWKDRIGKDNWMVIGEQWVDRIIKTTGEG